MGLGIGLGMLTACGDSDAADDGGMLDAAADDGAMKAALEGECPDGFTPTEGENTGFETDDGERVFHVQLPDDTSTPRPVFVALTGTVQDELDFITQSQLGELTDDGWIVLVPVRSCTQEERTCNGDGSIGSMDGRVWEPWFDGSFARDAGPDIPYMEAMVRCAAAEWPVDASQVHIGGISAGGTMTNHTMTFNSEFFAGGVNASGNWYDGLVTPRDARAMDRSIVITIWGGETDVWPLNNPIAVYDRETLAAAQYYARQDEVVHVACSGTHGHIWPTYITTWIAETLRSHPKGTDPADFELTEPPSGVSCVIGEYTDH